MADFEVALVKYFINTAGITAYNQILNARRLVAPAETLIMSSVYPTFPHSLREVNFADLS